MLKEMNYSVSVSDLIRHPDYQKYCDIKPEWLDYIKSAPEGLSVVGVAMQDHITTLLYQFGLDVSADVEYIVSAHRNTLGIQVFCGRYAGYERTDKEWSAYKYGGKK